ncbi:MAG: hypothetical protein AAGI03_09490 [Pseudomonadota bacterium]
MKLTILSCCALFVAVVSASAEQDPASDWQVKVTPYLWMTGLSGGVGRLPDGSPVQVDLSFRDVVEDLDLAGMVYGSVSDGLWTVYLDLTYVSSSSTEPLAGILFNETRVDSDTATFGLAIGRTIVRTDRASVTAYAGARAWWIENAFELRGIAGRPLRESSSEFWVDPLVGIAGQYEPNDKWLLTGALDVSGFGVAADSGFSALVGATYRVSDWVGVSVGWRHLEVDYSSDSTLFDIRQSGPLLGATIVF